MKPTLPGSGQDFKRALLEKAFAAAESCRYCGEPWGSNDECMHCCGQTGRRRKSKIEPMLDLDRKVITREGSANILTDEHLAGVDLWKTGRCVILLGDSRSGKSMAARCGFNELAAAGESVGWISESELFRKMREREEWRPRLFQVIDNCFSADTWEAFNSKSDEGHKARAAYRELIDYISNHRRHYNLLVTAIRAHDQVPEMPEDTSLRWTEILHGS